MKKLRLLIPGLALLALVGTGCIITSAQILVFYDLPNPVLIDAADGMERVLVDLNTIPDYADHKDNLKGLTDVAVLGTFTNVTIGGGSGVPGTVRVYITADNTNLADANAIIANAILLWGPATIGAAGTDDGTVVIGWDESAGLFTEIGKQILIDETKGDGVFTLYTVGSSTNTYAIQIDGGGLALTIDAGI